MILVIRSEWEWGKTAFQYNMIIYFFVRAVGCIRNCSHAIWKDHHRLLRKKEWKGEEEWDENENVNKNIFLLRAFAFIHCSVVVCVRASRAGGNHIHWLTMHTHIRPSTAGLSSA